MIAILIEGESEASLVVTTFADTLNPDAVYLVVQKNVVTGDSVISSTVTVLGIYLCVPISLMFFVFGAYQPHI